MEVIYTGLRRTPEQIVRAAIEEDVNVIGVSILSASHIAHLSKIQRLLEEQGALDIALVAGAVIPREDIPLLQEIGVKRVFVAGTPIGEIAEYVASILRAPAATQADVSVATLADVVVHVGMPGMGDQVQVSKAGMLEIADVYVVNKSDHPEAAKAIAHLRANIDLFYPGLPARNVSAAGNSVHGNPPVRRRHGSWTEDGGYWRPPVLSTCAVQASGVAELAAAADDFLAWSNETGRTRDRLDERLRLQILAEIRERLLGLCIAAATAAGVTPDRLAAEVSAGELGVREAAERLIEAFLRT